jgi:serine/threonine-protein kinase
VSHDNAIAASGSGRTSSGLGSYTKVCPLADGGMGTVEVVLRREQRFARLYAIKRLHPHMRGDPDLRAMFLDEARIAGLLRHPNVVSVLDVGEDGDGPFLVMDYIDGLSLGNLLAVASAQRERLPVQVCLQIARDVARGLHCAHELCGLDGQPLGLVHRDVSPMNVLVGYDGTVRITDFGVAKALGQSVLTGTGVLKGKISYMSPEQLRFDEIDRRADLFGLGTTLYEMLAGERLYQSKAGVEGARRILTEPAPDVGEVRSDVPPELVQLLFELLAKEADHRPPDAAAVEKRIQAIVVELMAEEGPIDVGEFVRELAAPLREAQKQKIAQALAAAEARVTATVAARRRRPLLLGAILAAAVAATIAIYVFRSEEPSAVSPRRAPGVTATPPAPAPEQGEVPTIELPEVELRGEAGDAPPARRMDEESAPEERSKSRRPRRREQEEEEKRPPPPDNERQGLPRWNWDG